MQRHAAEVRIDAREAAASVSASLRLVADVAEHHAAGFDPYDALRGTRVPGWCRRSRRGRQLAIQLRRRLPFATDRLYGVQPFVMAKTVGLLLTAAARCVPYDPSAEDLTRSLVEQLLASEGHLGDGRWGYEFDVQTRWSYYPQGVPNVIASYFAGRGLLEAGLALGDERIVGHAVEVARFITRELVDGSERPFVRYTPESQVLVHNANLLGAGFLAVVGRITGDNALIEAGEACARRSVDAQRQDGSWAYGESSNLGWSDNFHTAYNLDGLSMLVSAGADAGCRDALERGIAHWFAAFFGTDGRPYYLPGDGWPADIHCAATALEVGSRLADAEHRDVIERCLAWSAEELVQPDGYLPVYRRYRHRVDARMFPRWGAAPWCLGLVTHALVAQGGRTPIDSALSEG